MLLAAAAGGGCAVWLLSPPGGNGRVVVNIPRGRTALQIGRQLETAGVVRSGLVFTAWATLRGKAGDFKAGRYLLQRSWSAQQVAEILTRGGEPEDLVVTIPEGFTLKQIAARLEARRAVPSAQAFVEMASSSSPPVHAWFPVPKSGLEGYLYPDTYRIRPGTRPEAVLQMMVDQFDSEFAKPHRAEIEASQHSLHEIVTIASLIEREADTPDDRPMIAGVIENRLKRGMRLQIDATVLYAMGRHKERVLHADLRTDSPYNTYRQAGLPPGPIASPGISCLEAALRPAKHRYLYYVMSEGRGHVFTTNEADHNRAAARYRASRRRPASGL
jgi:UPF0755 protein